MNWKRIACAIGVVFVSLPLASCEVITVLFSSPKDGETLSGESLGVSYCVFGSSGTVTSTYELDGTPLTPVPRPPITPGDPFPCLLTGRSLFDSFEPAPDPGPHTLTVVVADASGNTGRGTVRFSMAARTQ